MALHERVAKSDEWYTPGYVFAAMDVTFDLDVASPADDCPADAWCVASLVSNSLSFDWYGFVWMNAPFGGRNGLEPWLNKFFAHGDGVALTPDRTSAPWWHQAVRRADAVLFIGKPNPPRGQSNKIRFIPGEGASESAPAQGTTLFASGPRGVQALRNAAAAGLGHLMISAIGAAPVQLREGPE